MLQGGALGFKAGRLNDWVAVLGDSSARISEEARAPVPNRVLKPAVMLAAMLFAAGPARAAEPADVYLQIVNPPVAYSGRITLSNGKVSIDGQVNHRPGATRTHMGRTIVIHEYARSKWLQFLPGSKQYIELSSRGYAKAPYLPPGLKRADLRVQTVGAETVAGEKTRKLKLTFPTGELTLWQTLDGIVIKSTGTATVHKRKHTVTMVMTKLKRGPQDPALFVPPPDAEPLGGPPKKKTGPRKKAAPKK